MKTFLFQTNVLIKGIATPMQFRAVNAVIARAYFEGFGKVVSDIRIIEG